MMIKNKDIIPDIKIEQLLPERAFIDFCNFDYHHHPKLSINSDFLTALEKDRFIFPLTTKKEKIIEDGTEKENTVRYYSPHQIYTVAAFSRNQVHDGSLWVRENLEFYKQQGFRFVNWGWGGYAFNISLGGNSGRLQQGNIWTLHKDFQNFLRMLHSFDLNKEYYGPKSRHYTLAPDISFKIPSLMKERFKEYELTEKGLNFLRREIAYLGTQIDPLEHWYYYIRRHPMWRRDDFKGEALLAQELYIVADLVAEVLEKVSGKAQPPIFELMYGDKNMYPYGLPRREYVHGIDIKSMWTSIKNFRDWASENSNKDFVDEDILSKLADFEMELKEYENKYGDRSAISNGIREVEVEEGIKLEDLDQKTKNYVDQILRQAQSELNGNKRQFISLWDDELEKRVKNKEISLDEAKKQDHELFIKREIYDAIEFRLGDLRRNLWSVFDLVEGKLRKKSSDAWDKVNNFSSYFYFDNKEKLSNLAREEQQKLYQIEYIKIHKEAECWSSKRDELGKIMLEMELLYCSVCRKRPVLDRFSSNEQRLSREAICADCEKDTQGLKAKNKGVWPSPFLALILMPSISTNAFTPRKKPNLAA